MLTQEQKDDLWKRIKSIKSGMLASWNGEYLHARPMRHVNNGFDGELLYFTNLASAKVDESQKYDDVCITYADVQGSNYVSISGEADLIQDRALIEKHWNSFVEAWFPNGKSDPNVAILRIRPYRAEYWDSPSSKVVQLFEIAKANLTNTTPNMGENRKFG